MLPLMRVTGMSLETGATANRSTTVDHLMVAGAASSVILFFGPCLSHLALLLVDSYE